MEDRQVLRRAALQVIRDGRLPNKKPLQTWGGPGDGSPCAICGRPTAADEMIFELEFDGDAQASSRPRAHPRCLAVWEGEILRLGEARSAATSDAACDEYAVATPDPFRSSPESGLSPAAPETTMRRHERDSFDGGGRK